MSDEKKESQQDDKRELDSIEDLNDVLLDSLETEDTIDDLEGVEEASDTLDEEVKTKAKSHGHISKEDWIAQGRDPAKYKDEKAFEKFGEEYKEVAPHIKMLKDELRKKDKALDAVSSQISDIQKREYERGKREAEAALKQAKQLGDIDAVERITREQVQTDLTLQQQRAQQVYNEQIQASNDFQDRNKHWYNADHQDLMDKAVAAATEIKQLYPTKNFQEVAEMVERRMKYEHPDVVNTGIDREPVVAPRSGVNKSALDSNSTGDKEVRQLNSEQRREFAAIKKMVERVSGGISYTMKDYVKSLKRDHNHGRSNR